MRGDLEDVILPHPQRGSLESLGSILKFTQSRYQGQQEADTWVSRV